MEAERAVLTAAGRTPARRVWRDSFNEFQVHFDDQGRVKEISTDALTHNLVVKE